MKKRSNLIFQAFINLQSMRFMMSVYLVLVISMLFVIPTISADPGSSDAQQNITVSGTVIDAEGVPMPGVSISVKGTSMGVNTDMSGKYSLKVPSQESILVFAFVGMKAQEITIGNQSVININNGE